VVRNTVQTEYQEVAGLPSDIDPRAGSCRFLPAPALVPYIIHPKLQASKVRSLPSDEHRADYHLITASSSTRVSP
jgi:hypothetical protein